LELSWKWSSPGVRILDLFGSAAFTIVQSDLKGNIAVSHLSSPQTLLNIPLTRYIRASSSLSSDRNPNLVINIRSATQQKVRARYAKAPEQSATLEDLVKNEKFENKGKVGTAGEGLMWLIRYVR